jgi:hypothetical protein
MQLTNKGEKGAAKTGILLWLLGVPIPVILLILLFKSCV